MGLIFPANSALAVIKEQICYGDLDMLSPLKIFIHEKLASILVTY